MQRPAQRRPSALGVGSALRCALSRLPGSARRAPILRRPSSPTAAGPPRRRDARLHPLSRARLVIDVSLNASTPTIEDNDAARACPTSRTFEIGPNANSSSAVGRPRYKVDCGAAASITSTATRGDGHLQPNLNLYIRNFSAPDIGMRPAAVARRGATTYSTASRAIRTLGRLRGKRGYSGGDLRWRSRDGSQCLVGPSSYDDLTRALRSARVRTDARSSVTASRCGSRSRTSARGDE